MLPDRVSNPGPLTYESGALPIALRGPARTTLYLVCTALSCSHKIIKLFRRLNISFGPLDYLFAQDN